MNISLATNLRNGIVEIYLNRFALKPGVDNAIWNLPQHKLRDLRIRWPNKYQWDAASDWVDVLKSGFRRHVRIEIVDNIPQPYKGTVVFQIAIGNTYRDVAIGYSDYMPIDDLCAKSCDLYFKMQYDRNGYGCDHVVPGGYVPDGKRLYFQLARLRRVRDTRDFRFDVNGRFGLNYAREIREKAVNILTDQKAFSFEGGMKTVSYSEFLKEVARSKVCIDLPGLGDFCFRLMNYLAVGACVIAYPHRTSLHIPLIDRKHIVYCKEDFSDLAELCEYYLENDDEREQIAQNAREFFDLYLHKDNLVKYYLHMCVDRLS